MVRKPKAYMVRTDANTVMTEAGELRWAGICGTGGLKIKTWKTRRAAEKVAERFNSVAFLNPKVVEVEA